MTCARSVLLKVRNSISLYDHTKITSVLAFVAISRRPPGGGGGGGGGGHNNKDVQPLIFFLCCC